MTNLETMRIDYESLITYINQSLADIVNLDSKEAFSKFKRVKLLLNYELEKYRANFASMSEYINQLEQENERLLDFMKLVELTDKKDKLEIEIKLLKGKLNGE